MKREAPPGSPPQTTPLRRQMLSILALLAVASLGLTLLLGLERATSEQVSSPSEPATIARDMPAPPLAGRTLAGDSFDLAALRGHVALVNVFASWCGPCRTELPILVHAQQRWSAQGLHVVGLDVRDGLDAARALLDETGAASLTVVPDASGATAVNWGVRGVPETFLIDRDGRIRQWVQGPITMEWLEKWLPPLLAS